MGFPIGLAVFMAVKRDVFLSLHGFDSSAEPYEDSEYLLRVHRQIAPPANGKSAVGILHPSLYVWHSMRRYDVKRAAQLAHFHRHSRQLHALVLQ